MSVVVFLQTFLLTFKQYNKEHDKMFNDVVLQLKIKKINGTKKSVRLLELW
jgi:hypothetical protein